MAENPRINIGSIQIELTADDPPEGEETDNAGRRRHGRLNDKELDDLKVFTN